MPSSSPIPTSNLTSNNGNTTTPSSSSSSSNILNATNSNNHTTNTNPNSPSNNSNTTLRKPLDPTLLARGMTARSVGSRISSSIKSLSNVEIEKDFRHMEAYGSACIVYAQQFFAFTNRELIARGHFSNGGVGAPNANANANAGATTAGGAGGSGTAGGAAGGAAGAATGNGSSTVPPGVTYSDTNTTLYPHQQQHQQHQQTDANGHPINVGMGGITMPVRIDPEEEKRLSILRTRVAASEAKREILETEYLSLRAHYVHESHKLHRARSVVSGQMKLLKDLVQRKGDILAMYRARYGIAKEILHCLEFRSDALKKDKELDVIGGGEDDHNVDKTNVGNNNSALGQVDSNGDVVMFTTENLNAIPGSIGVTDSIGVGDSKENKGKTSSSSTTTTTMVDKNRTNDSASKDKSKSQTREDLSAIWDLMESQLQEAEQACTSNVETPEELLQMKAALAADAAALEAATERSSFANGSIVQRNVRSPTRGGSNEGENDTSSVTPKKKNGKKGDEVGSTDLNGKKGKGDGDINIIPWNCPVYPRTPYDVAILLSNLSTAPDGAAAFACGDSQGRPSNSLLWLEANLPASQNDEINEEAKRLQRVRDEVKALSEELASEVRANSDLQMQISKGRTRRDQLCSMMSMIRSETEAVIERYNEVLQTPEAISEADSLRQNNKKLDEPVNYIEEEYDEEGDLGDGENSDGTVVPGDGDDEGDDTVDDQFNQFSSSEVYDDFNNGGHPMREITVRIDQSSESVSPSIPSISKNGPLLNNNNNKRGYDVSRTDEPINESENKRRKI